ncbi:hypothetical protein AAVH_17486 [Aphelenchoides avenae]|nr:hypothetical protein AAVH_17486 [Aphelenchus avenae]
MQPISLSGRRVRLALEGYVDVFKLLPRNDLNALEISCRTFQSVVSNHLDSVCLIAMKAVRMEGDAGRIFMKSAVKFTAVDKSRSDPAPDKQKRFRENVYVMLQRIACKCLVKKLIINYPKLDDIACKALIAIQPNVGLVTFGGKSASE